ncbi:Conserved hypothetical protein [Micromonospora lupini str. Lupac 08]|uniref:Uncharacterized protein n=1 Tax=Micromonospora lupini str. Lupac 08 TaxID=1150864 RepID=I0L6B3_9ACTN|nr:Conserved hypothetical protein [Micromonospora lupini str. Lupac 08]
MSRFPSGDADPRHSGRSGHRVAGASGRDAEPAGGCRGRLFTAVHPRVPVREGSPSGRWRWS